MALRHLIPGWFSLNSVTVLYLSTPHQTPSSTNLLHIIPNSSNMRLIAAVLLAPLAALATPVATGNDAQPTLAPLSTTGEHIDDAYIVVFKKGVDPNQIALHLSGVEQAHETDVSDSFLIWLLYSKGLARIRAL